MHALLLSLYLPSLVQLLVYAPTERADTLLLFLLYPFLLYVPSFPSFPHTACSIKENRREVLYTLGRICFFLVKGWLIYVESLLYCRLHSCTSAQGTPVLPLSHRKRYPLSSPFNTVLKTMCSTTCNIALLSFFLSYHKCRIRIFLFMYLAAKVLIIFFLEINGF